MQRQRIIRGHFRILLLAGVLLSNFLLGQPNEYLRRYLTVNDGLAQNEVTAINEDPYGFIWFGTRGGVSRFDGYNFKNFKPDRNLQNSLLNPSVECLFCDSNGRYWIGTKSGGVSIYDPLTENFVPADSFIQNIPNRVISVYEDFDGIFWIGGFYDGLVSYDPVTGESKSWFTETSAQSIIQTPDSTIWVGSSNVLRYKRPGEEFKEFNPGERFFTVTEILIDSENPWIWFSGWGLPLIKLNYKDLSYESYTLPENMMRIYSLLDDQEGRIWLGTWGSGLFTFDKEKHEYNKVDIYPDARFSLITDYDIILDIYRNPEGLIWIGTDGGGVVLLSPSSGFNAVNTFKKGQKYHVTCIMDTEDDYLLFGTRGQGLMISESPEQTWRVNIRGENAAAAVQNVYSIGKTENNLVWVGMEKGLYVLDKISHGQYTLIPASVFFSSPDFDMRLAKVLDVKIIGNDFWVATQQRGLFRFSWDGMQYHQREVYSSSGGLNSNRVTNLELDKKNQLWACTYNGIYRFNAQDSVFIPLKEIIQGGDLPLCNIVLTSHVDSENNLWFGTPCTLNKLSFSDKQGYVLTEYTRNNGLSDDYISNVLGDDHGAIWFTNNAGISKIDIDNGTVFNYSKGDGTGDYNFSESAAYKSPGGDIYFGSSSGYTHFNPTYITENRTSPPIAFTSFKVLNREVNVTEDGLLSVSINEIDKIVLGHKDKEISFEFAALDYKSPGRNQYLYMLERKGTTGQWEYLGNRRMISYQNLKPGEYNLYIKGSNSNGIWNESSRKLELKVLSSPLKRWYSIVVYILFLLFIVFLIIQTSLKQERLRNEAHMEHVSREQEKQMNEFKLRFFTNISHEFRTPLSMILAPLNELVKNEKGDLNRQTLKKLGMIKKNADRLLKLINQLIEFRKVEVGKVKLEASEGDIVNSLKELIQPFKELAEQKGISFRTDFRIRKTMVYFDPGKFSVVINNLLNNAIKYCGVPGSVSVEVYDTPQEIAIKITNDGKGIRPSDIEHIFDRFYQVSSSRYMDSSGIGLALAKNYMEMHNGSISVESRQDELTIFEVRLKKGVDHLSEENIVTGSQESIITENFLMEMEEQSTSAIFHHKGTRGSKIVIIDDNRDVREYLTDLLSPYYEITTAEDGKQGFDLIVEIVPDLIISDVMMPEMDGYELCEKIKSNVRLSHIPFAMLTAKDSASDMIFGAKKGADYYITKPFDPDLVREKIRQILYSRKELEQKFSRKVLLDPVDKEITTDDERILKAAIKMVEKNIENDNLNLDMMAAEMAMSSSTLYRKMKSITGQSPGEFIKSVKFKRAAQLLRDSDLAVSEIIEQVGYHSVKQFRENFKSEFGVSPATYRKQFREGDIPPEQA